MTLHAFVYLPFQNLLKVKTNPKCEDFKMGILIAAVATLSTLGDIPDVGERDLSTEIHENKTSYRIFHENVEIDMLTIAGQCTKSYIHHRSDEWVCETPNRTYYLKLLASDKVQN